MRSLITLLALLTLAVSLPAQVTISPSTPGYNDVITLHVDVEIPVDGVEVDNVTVNRDGTDVEVVVDLDVDIFSYDPDGTSRLQFDAELGTFPPGDYTLTMIVEVFGIEIHRETTEFSVPPGTSLEIENLVAHLVSDAPLVFIGDVNTDGKVDAADLVKRVNNL